MSIAFDRARQAQHDAAIRAVGILTGMRATDNIPPQHAKHVNEVLKAYDAAHAEMVRLADQSVLRSLAASASQR